MTEPTPQPARRGQHRTPHWLGYIVVAVAAFLLGAVMDTGTPDCGGYAAPAHTVTVVAA